MDGLTLEGVLAWMEKQQPYMLQVLLHKCTNLLTEHANSSPSEDSAAEDASNGGTNEDQTAPNLQDEKREPRTSLLTKWWEEGQENISDKYKKFKMVKLVEINREALLDINKTLLEEFRQKQIALFGGDEKFFNIVHKSMKNLQENNTLVGAQKVLFKYRKSFFNEHFPDPGCEGNCLWFTDGGDSTMGDVLPFQITQNFDEVSFKF